MTNKSKTGIMFEYSEIAPLAKLDIASVYGTEGQEFESLTVHHLKPNPILKKYRVWLFYRSCIVRGFLVFILCCVSQGRLVFDALPLGA